jgi:diguanylate cyclase (GGDEF)-like protein
MDARIDCVLNQGSAVAFEALHQLGVGILLANEHGCITFANPTASALFAPLHPVGVSLHALLGLSGAFSGRPLTEASQDDIETLPIRAVLPDGRTIDCQTRALSGNGTLVSLLDVTNYVSGTESTGKDLLTGLADRAALRARAEVLLQRSVRTGDPAAVFCLGLDRFKVINDTLGHATGDELLGKVADRLRGSSRVGDVLARLGGDEFALVQADAQQPHGAEALAARLVDLIGRPYVIRGQAVNIGVSVGVAVLPQDGQDFSMLLKHADLALRRAKADGKGTFRFFQPGMDAASRARRVLELELRRALALKQFETAYQPQFALGPDTLVGFEALVRWRHPDRGFVSPAEFLPLAEEIGLIDQIGDWVLETACKAVASWSDRISVAVNISPLQFRGTRLVGAVKSAVRKSGLAPSRLELEITEGALLNNSESVLDTLHGLKSIGIRLSMDDFGTGYSSLSYLQKFPFDTVKIDQSFVRSSDTRQECAAIVRAVAALGKSLGLATIAEGVETPEQLERVRSAGCSAVQGYLTGRPLWPGDAKALVQKHPTG